MKRTILTQAQLQLLEQALEIDRRQNVILPACQRTYANVWGLEFAVNVMDICEICAEKVRAANQRARYRDFYDLYLILEAHPMDLAEAFLLLRHKEIRAPLTAENIRANWQIARMEREDDMRSIFCARSVENKAIEAMLNDLAFDPIRPE